MVDHSSQLFHFLLADSSRNRVYAQLLASHVLCFLRLVLEFVELVILWNVELRLIFEWLS